MMTTHKYLLFSFTILLFCCLAFPAVAQDNNLNKEVQVTRAYDPTVSDANKIDMQVKRNDTLTSISPKFQYNILPVSISSDYTVRPIPPAKITQQAYQDPHFVYFRAGLGFPQTILGDFYINNIKPSGLSVGAFYNLRSLHGDITNSHPNGSDIPTDDITHNAGIFLRKYFDKSTLGFEGGFNQHRVLFYGYENSILDYKPDYIFHQDSLAQVYNSFDGRVNFMSNTRKDADFTYTIDGIFNLFQDRGDSHFSTGRMFSMKEMAFGAKLGLSKKITENHGVAFKADFTNYNHKLDYNERFNRFPTNTLSGNDLQLFPLYAQFYGQLEGADLDQNRYDYNITPSYIYTADKFKAELGVKLNGNTNELGKQKTNVYPQIEASYIAADELVVYAGIGGYNEVNSYKKLAAENPYILPGLAYGMGNSSHSYEGKIGFQGNIENLFSYNAYVTYSSIKDMYFYHNAYLPVNFDTTASVTNYSLYNNFDVLRDDVKEFKFVAEMSATFRSIRSSLKAAFMNYNTDNLQAAYHRPTFTVNFTTDLTVARYLILSANVYAQSKTQYYNYDLPEDKFYNDAFVDVGLGAEYLFNRNFSVFVNASNLLSKKYEVYHQYKVPGVRVLGGLTLKF